MSMMCGHYGITAELGLADVVVGYRSVPENPCRTATVAGLANVQGVRVRANRPLGACYWARSYGSCG